MMMAHVKIVVNILLASSQFENISFIGTPIVAWITTHIVAIYPPSPMVLEINATGYSGVSWLINGTVMHDFARVTLENDNKKFTLSDTSNEDIGHYVAAVHLINGTIVTLDFQVGLYG